MSRRLSEGYNRVTASKGAVLNDPPPANPVPRARAREVAWTEIEHRLPPELSESLLAEIEALFIAEWDAALSARATRDETVLAARDAAREALALHRSMAMCGEPSSESSIVAFQEGMDAIDWLSAQAGEVEELKAALNEINELRSNIIATQSATWSNVSYPLVAILNRAGFELIKERTEDEKDAHLAAYGGAGGSPRHPHESQASIVANMRRQRARRLTEHGAEGT